MVNSTRLEEWGPTVSKEVRENSCGGVGDELQSISSKHLLMKYRDISAYVKISNHLLKINHRLIFSFFLSVGTKMAVHLSIADTVSANKVSTLFIK